MRFVAKIVHTDKTEVATVKDINILANSKEDAMRALEFNFNGVEVISIEKVGD